MAGSAARLDENKFTIREDALKKEEDEDDSSGFENVAGKYRPPDEAEEEERRLSLLFSFHESLSDDPPVQELFGLILLEGITVRSVQAENLKISPTKLDALKKRLETRVQNFAKQNKFKP